MKYPPDGPVEQDLVLTIAKCLWRKARCQRFLMARATDAKFDPRHEACDPVSALTAFYDGLQDATISEEIRRGVALLDGLFAGHLGRECPREKFDTDQEWVKAMQEEAEKVLMPMATRFGNPPDEVLMMRSAAILTDDRFSRELEFEERIDRMLWQAIGQLEKIKKSKQQTSFRQARRFGRAKRD
jgi:hypothetical protein